MSETNKETALVVSDFAIMAHSVEDLGAMITANVGTGQLGPGDLDRIKVPAGGGTTWEVPSIDGDRSTRNLDGIIAAWREPRAYWEHSIDDTGGGEPPDCSSQDGITGIGTPGGSCADCPYAKFGSAKDKKGNPADGQACKQMRMMAIILKDDLLPMLLVAPPTSLRNLRQYFLRLVSAAVPFYGVVTRFTLVKAKNKAGTEYSQIQARSLEKLDEATKKKMEGYAQLIGKSLERAAPHAAGDYTESE